MSDDRPLTFEEAMSRLERIVSELETGKHPLEEALRMFEEGIALGKQCRQFLERADMRVRTLVERGDGSFEEGASFDGGGESEAEDGDDAGRE